MTVEGCSDAEDGDNGMMLRDPDPALAQCDSSYSSFGAFSETELFDGICRSPEDRSEIIEDRAGRMFSNFQCVTSPGNHGCGFEQPLEAALKALTTHAGPGGPNHGFLRDDSFLYILFITDEDDCSVDLSDPDNERIFDLSGHPGETPNTRCRQYQDALYPVDRYVEAFSNLRDDPYHLMIGLLIGVPAPSLCNGLPHL